jgi:hypothetical protein
MTVVAAVSTGAEICVVADCRLSIVDDKRRLLVAQDVCQKLIAANTWSIVGFSGDLCLARILLVVQILLCTW